jgi:Tfp pilus assembly protein PilF
MRLTSGWKIWIGMALMMLLSACGTTGGKQEQKSAGIESLTPSQAARFQEALAQLDQQQPKKAENVLESLLRERTDVAELWLNLALSQYQQNNFAAADKTVTRILAAYPRTVQAHNLAGLLAVENGEFKKAEQHYAEALKLSPQYVNALYNMALLQDIYLQNTVAAVDYYQAYLKLEKDDEATKAWVENLTQSLGR